MSPVGGHGCGPFEQTSDSTTGVGQCSKVDPLDAAQFLCLVLVPWPQVTGHAAHSPHSVRAEAVVERQTCITYNCPLKLAETEQ